MIKYKTIFNEIQKIEVVSATEKSVFLCGGRREAKRSGYQNWHDSFDDAKAFLVAMAEKEVETARANLEKSEKTVAQLREIQE